MAMLANLIHNSFRSPLCLAVVAALFAAGPAAQAATLVVDDDGQATALNCNASTAAFTTIQAAVAAASSGDTIQVCPGTFNEQVAVTKSQLTIRGAGAGATVLRPSAVVANATNLFGNSVSAILLVEGATNVNIASLEIDGSLADSGAMLLALCCRSIPAFSSRTVRAPSTPRTSRGSPVPRTAPSESGPRPATLLSRGA